MSKTVLPPNDIAPFEGDVLRVFAISRPIHEMARAVKAVGKELLATELLGTALPEKAVEIFAISDLADIGLPQYLAEGHDIPRDQLGPDQSKLKALDGYVLILYSTALADQGATLQPHDDVIWIGSYTRASKITSAPPIPSDAAKPYSGTPNLTPATPPSGRAGGAMVALGVVTLIALILWWSFS